MNTNIKEVLIALILDASETFLQDAVELGENGVELRIDEDGIPSISYTIQ